MTPEEVEDEEVFAAQPGSLLINRYMWDQSLKKRKEALENLRKLLQTLIDIEKRKERNKRVTESSNPVGVQES